MSVFDFPSRAAWALLAIAGVMAYGGFAMLGIEIRFASATMPLAACAACLAGSSFYARVRPDPRLATILAGTAFLLAFGVTIAVLTYPAAAIGGALRDNLFVAFERKIGIDWPALAALMSASPILNCVWAFAYMSSLPQMAVAVLVLGLADRRDRLAAYLTLLALTLAYVIAFFVLAPALGPIVSYGVTGDLYAHLGPGGKDFLGDFDALRRGTFKTFDLARMEGIITFPSFHCVLAILTSWALAPVRRVGGAAILLNLLVVLSTVPQGGHYVADILVGSLIACIAIAAWTLATRRELSASAACPVRAGSG